MRNRSVITAICFELLTSLLVGCASSPPPKYSEQSVVSNEQLIALLSDHRNQPKTIWTDVDPGYLQETGGGWGGVGLSYQSSATGLFENQLQHGWIHHHPLSVLPLMSSRDADTALTGLCPFYWTREGMDQLSGSERAAVANAIRAHLLVHPDARVRSAGIITLATGHELSARDIEVGLKDPALTVEVQTAMWMVNHPPGDHSPTRQQAADIIPVVVSHLNSTNFVVREECYSILHDSLKIGSCGDPKPAYLSAIPDPSFDWGKASWDQYTAQQKRWQQWWNDHGAAAIAEAYPDEAARR